MNESKTLQPDSKSRFRCLLPHLIAFAIILFAAVSYSYFGTQPRSMFPSDSLVIQTYGHNDEALRALHDAHIPKLVTTDISASHRASFLTFLFWTARYLGVIFIAYFIALTLLKRILNDTANA